MRAEDYFLPPLDTQYSGFFCLPLTELGNTISSLFGGGGPVPETGENLTDSVQVSPRVIPSGREPLGLAVAAKEAAICVSRIKGVWQHVRILNVVTKCFIPLSFMWCVFEETCALSLASSAVVDYC